MKKPRVLVTGASGKLGAYVVRELSQRGREVVAWSGRSQGQIEGVPLRPVDLKDSDQIKEAFGQAQAPSVVHCAAISSVAEAHSDFEAALLVNRDATALLAELSTRLVYTSTDLVFDGENAPYDESAKPSPSSRYGESKLLGEEALRGHEGCLSCRMSLMYGPTLLGHSGFFDRQVESLELGRKISLFEDEWRTPLALDEAASALIGYLDSDITGRVHLAGPERLSRYEMGLKLAKFLRLPSDLVIPTQQNSVHFPEPRPRDVSLKSKLSLMEDFSNYEESLLRLMA